MKKYDFNQDWTVRCLTRECEVKKVTLPHDAMIDEPRNMESTGEGNIGWYLGGDYEYKKMLMIPEENKNKANILEFESVYHNAEVYVNGEKAAFRPYGYTNFYVDLNPYAKFGQDNEIRVIARNLDQPNSRWYPGTGIYRPAWYYTGGKNYILLNGLQIKTLSIDPAVISVKVKTNVEGTVAINILKDGKCISTASLTGTPEGGSCKITVPDAKLWNVDTPELYQCQAVFGDDTVTETFGIRLLTWDAEKGIAINGEHVILKGACIHHDNGLLGACTYEKVEKRKIRILKEHGYNAVRSSHYPCSKDLLRACDEIGMLMMDEYVDVWYMHKTKYDYALYLQDWWKQDLKDMVEKDFNHPCVIMYSTGNEVAETAQKKGIELTGQFTKYLHELDGTRPVTCGINIFFNFLSSIGMGVYSDDKAEKQAKAAEEAAAKKKAEEKKNAGKPKKKPVGSEFYNTLACLMGDYFMKFGATLYPCDLKTRDAFANMDVAGYNYGLFRYKHDLKKYPNRLILGSETFCKDAYSFYEIAKKHPRIVGDFVWAGWDYLGEVGEGCAEFSDYKFEDPSTRMTGGNGRIDLLGKPRAEAAYTRVAFEVEQGPIIAVMPVYQTEKLQITGWQLTKALESWSYAGCNGMPATVEVYARAAEVELFINGKSVGRKKVKKNCRFIFKTTYEDGEITAVSYDASGKEIGRYSLQTAKKESILRLLPEEESLQPEEIGFINLRYTDEDGIWKPMEKHDLHVTVENGTLLGLGSANAYKKGNYTDSVTDTYYGEAQAVIRAGKEGPVKVSVSDETHTVTIDIPVCKA